jgi:hypothetical protein
MLSVKWAVQGMIPLRVKVIVEVKGVVIVAWAVLLMNTQEAPAHDELVNGQAMVLCSGVARESEPVLTRVIEAETTEELSLMEGTIEI